jgi:hypothetical protein
MKYAAARPYADSEKAARKLLEIATEVDVVQDGRIHIEKLNGAFLHREKGFQRSTAQASPMPSKTAGCGSTKSRTYTKFTQAGADLFAWFDSGTG